MFDVKKTTAKNNKSTLVARWPALAVSVALPQAFAADGYPYPGAAVGPGLE